MTLEEFQTMYAEGRYTSVGSYPKFGWTTNGEVICWDCITRDFATYMEELQKGRTTLVGFEVNYERSDLLCDRCSNLIERAYGNDESS